MGLVFSEQFEMDQRIDLQNNYKKIYKLLKNIILVLSGNEQKSSVALPHDSSRQHQ